MSPGILLSKENKFDSVVIRLVSKNNILFITELVQKIQKEFIATF